MPVQRLLMLKNTKYPHLTNKYAHFPELILYALRKLSILGQESVAGVSAFLFLLFCLYKRSVLELFYCSFLFLLFCNDVPIVQGGFSTLVLSDNF